MDIDFLNYLSLDKIKNRINKLPSNRACGLDGIHTVILQSLNDSKFPMILFYLFHTCIELGVTPIRWNKSFIYPIPKKEKSKYISDFRPISITNIFRKLFELLVLDFIQEKLKGYFKLCCNQAGFRSGYSTLTHAIVSDATTIKNRYHVFLDLKKAYDSVPICLLVNKLIKRKVPSGMVSIITSLFTECTTTVLVNQTFTKEIKLERGLLQGSILSPLLFNVFIDDLAQQLTDTYPNDPLPHCLLYADDIKLNHNNIKDLQNMLDICSNWAEINGMEFNINKSAYLLKSHNNSPICNTYNGYGYGSGYRFSSVVNFGSGSRSGSGSGSGSGGRSGSGSGSGSGGRSGSGSGSGSGGRSGSGGDSDNGGGQGTNFIYSYFNNNVQDSMNNIELYLKINNKKELLKGQYSYDYLGFPHTTNGIQWKKHLEDSASKALSILKSIHFRNDVLPHYIRLIIFKTFIRPLMEHGACLAFYWMDENDLNKLENINLIYDFKEIKYYNEVINEGVKWIVNHKKISNPSCLLGIPKAMTRLYCLALKFKKHLYKMDKENPLYIAFNPPPNINRFKSPSLAYRCYTTKDLFTRYKYFGPTDESPDTQLSHINKRIDMIIYYDFTIFFVI
eukprot:jgi/Orpsp1_1/1189096/evm.model.d7180000069483.1